LAEVECGVIEKYFLTLNQNLFSVSLNSTVNACLYPWDQEGHFPSRKTYLHSYRDPLNPSRKSSTPNQQLKFWKPQISLFCHYFSCISSITAYFWDRLVT